MRLIHRSTNQTKLLELDTPKGLYQFVRRVQYQEKAFSARSTNSEVWHKRLGHCSMEVMKASLPNVTGVSIEKVKPFLACESCAIEKSKRRLRAEINNTIRSGEPLE